MKTKPMIEAHRLFYLYCFAYFVLPKHIAMQEQQKDERLWKIARRRAEFRKSLYSFIVIVAFMWGIWWSPMGRSVAFLVTHGPSGSCLAGELVWLSSFSRHTMAIRKTCRSRNTIS
jgi:hypothetical protein